jgi:MFS family permease
MGVFLWSLMTGLCALARSFWSLFFARTGVGVGEATLNPSAFSLISDYFPKERLATAISVFSMGIFIGSGLAMIVGGTVVGAVSQLPPIDLGFLGMMSSWRLTFLIVGLPGILVAAWVLTIREPERRNLLRTKDGQASQLSVGDVAAQLKLRWQSVFGISFAYAFQSTCTYAFNAWAPTLFLRVHHWTPGETGVALGIIILITGCTGMYIGGRLCDHWQQRRVAVAPLKVGVIGAVGTGVIFALTALTASNPVLTMALMVPGLLFLALPIGTAHASIQLILPNQVRGQISALYLFILNLVGLTLGPLLPGVFNDYLFRNENMIGYSLALTIAIGAALNVLMLKVTYNPYRRHYALMHGN